MKHSPNLSLKQLFQKSGLLLPQVAIIISQFELSQSIIHFFKHIISEGQFSNLFMELGVIFAKVVDVGLIISGNFNIVLKCSRVFKVQKLTLLTVVMMLKT